MHRQLQGTQSQQPSPDEVAAASARAPQKGLRLELPTGKSAGSAPPGAGRLQPAVPDDNWHDPLAPAAAAPSAAVNYEELDDDNADDHWGGGAAAEQQHHAGSDGKGARDTPGGLAEVATTPGRKRAESAASLEDDA